MGNILQEAKEERNKIQEEIRVRLHEYEKKYGVEVEEILLGHIPSIIRDDGKIVEGYIWSVNLKVNLKDGW